VGHGQCLALRFQAELAGLVGVVEAFEHGPVVGHAGLGVGAGGQQQRRSGESESVHANLFVFANRAGLTSPRPDGSGPPSAGRARYRERPRPTMATMMARSSCSAWRADICPCAAALDKPLAAPSMPHSPAAGSLPPGACGASTSRHFSMKASSYSRLTASSSGDPASAAITPGISRPWRSTHSTYDAAMT